MHGVSDIAALGATVSEYRARFELRHRNRHRLPKGGYPMERVLAGEAFDEVVILSANSGDCGQGCKAGHACFGPRLSIQPMYHP
jgi:hypothetical protein